MRNAHLLSLLFASALVTVATPSRAQAPASVAGAAEDASIGTRPAAMPSAPRHESR